MSPNLRAFLDMIAVSELGEGLLAVSDNGYNVLVGSSPKAPILFESYADHPRRVMTLGIKGKSIKSSAAGRYQLLARYFDAYRRQLDLKDFSPAAQDAIAIQQIRECRALPDIGGSAAERDPARERHLGELARRRVWAA